MISLVVSVWGGVFYKLFTTFFPKEESTAVSMILPEQSNTIVSSPDTFSIALNYRDPFLGKTYSDKPSAAPIKKRETNPKPIVQLNWPSILYGGMIKNKASNKLQAIIQINGQSHLMKAGDVVAGIILKSISKDSIGVAMDKENRFIKKQ